MLLAVSSVSYAAHEVLDVTQVKTDKGQQLAIDVFDNIFSFNLPSNYTPINEEKYQDGYVFDAAPNGQNTENWSSLVTLTGQKDLATVPGLTLNKLLDLYVKGVKDNCITSFSAVNVPDSEVDGLSMKTALLRCGKVKDASGKEFSHTMIMGIVQGKKDIYTLRYIERSNPQKKIDAVTVNKFMNKMNELKPIFVCAGDKADAAKEECAKRAHGFKL